MQPMLLDYGAEHQDSQSHFDDCYSDNEKWDDIYNYNENQLINHEKQKQRKKPVFKQRKKWTSQEDDKLLKLVISFGINNWRHLAKKMDGRNPRQCRERWTYYLNPYLKHDNWTYEEDEMILKLRNYFGPKWMLISNYFPNRTDAMIKNRYNVLCRITNKKVHISQNDSSSIDIKNDQSNQDSIDKNQDKTLKNGKSNDQEKQITKKSELNQIDPLDLDQLVLQKEIEDDFFIQD